MLTTFVIAAAFIFVVLAIFGHLLLASAIIFQRDTVLPPPKDAEPLRKPRLSAS